MDDSIRNMGHNSYKNSLLLIGEKIKNAPESYHMLAKHFPDNPTIQSTLVNISETVSVNEVEKFMEIYQKKGVDPEKEDFRKVSRTIRLSSVDFAVYKIENGL